MESSELPPLWPDVPEEFCAALKAARVRRGLTLAEISQRTKITESHFVALERADLRHWPKGIFRRAFFSDYVRAVGLPVEPTLAVFMRLFPDPAAAPDERAGERTRLPLHGGHRTGPGEMRMVLAAGPRIPPGAASRARLAVGDAACVTALAMTGIWMAKWDAAMTFAIAALFYYSLATVIARPHPGPALVRRAARALAPPGRPRVGVPALAGVAANLLDVSGLARLRAWVGGTMNAGALRQRWKAIEFPRLKGIDLQRLKQATPQVIDRLTARRTERRDRPMARPRADSPRHARRRADAGGAPEDTGVRIRIRLTR